MKINFKKGNPYFLTWLLLRLFASINAAVFSNIKPITYIENKIAVWPPSLNFGSWLNRVFLAPWLRWDAIIYVRLITYGYAAGDGSTSFHPLYIILCIPLYMLGFDPIFCLLIISSLATLGFFWIFYKLVRLDLTPQKSQLALFLLASFPISIILFFPYTESVFLFFSAMAFYLMRKRRWVLASIVIFLASLTRQQGVFLIFPILWYSWEDSGKSFVGLFRAWKGWLAAVTAPVGLFTWTIYRLYFLQEGVAEFNNWQGFIYSVFLSPSAKKIFPDQAIVWPWTAFAIALPKLIKGPDIGDLMSVALGLLFLVLFAIAWKHLQPAYRIYSLVIVLISFSMSTGSFRIYLSLPRHLLLAFPVFIGLAISLKQRWQQIILICMQFLVQAFMLFIYVTKSWIP